MNEISHGHVSSTIEVGRSWVSEFDFYCEFPTEMDRRHQDEQFIDLLQARLVAGGLSESRIGITAGLPLLSALASCLPQMHVEPCKSLNEITRVKHMEELRLMEQLADLTHVLQNKYRSTIEPGLLVRHLDAEVSMLAHELAGERFPGEDFVIRVWTYAGEQSIFPSGSAGDAGARIKIGDALVNYIIPNLNGVQIEDERTFFCADASEEQRRAYSAVLSANKRGTMEFVEGREARAFDLAARNTLCDLGYGDYVCHRTGHGIGLDNHELILDTGFSTRYLLAGEVYSCEPGVYIEGVGGIRIDDTVVVGTDHPEVLTSTPKSLEFAVSESA